MPQNPNDKKRLLFQCYWTSENWGFMHPNSATRIWPRRVKVLQYDCLSNSCVSHPLHFFQWYFSLEDSLSQCLNNVRMLNNDKSKIHLQTILRMPLETARVTQERDSWNRAMLLVGFGDWSRPWESQVRIMSLSPVSRAVPLAQVVRMLFSMQKVPGSVPAVCVCPPPM